jgi:cytochrome oxidase assembly protein ShyY1
MHFNQSLGPLTIRGDLRAVLAGVVLMALLLNLGSWQLSRAAEKSALQGRWEERAALPPVSPASLIAASPEARADRQVRWQGEFTSDQYLLLDNRLHRGHPGYHVIALVTAGASLVPVNMGWIAGDPARQTLPVPVLPEGTVFLSGRIYVPSGKPLMMQKPTAPVALPAPVQTLYWDNWQQELAALAGRPLLPFEVRIDPDSPLALTAEWPVVNQSSSQHIGYAVQWFAMAGVLLLIGVWRLTNVVELLGRRDRA